jgi:hypothetical protein
MYTAIHVDCGDEITAARAAHGDGITIRIGTGLVDGLIFLPDRDAALKLATDLTAAATPDLALVG